MGVMVSMGPDPAISGVVVDSVASVGSVGSVVSATNANDAANSYVTCEVIIPVIVYYTTSTQFTAYTRQYMYN